MPFAPSLPNNEDDQAGRRTEGVPERKRGRQPKAVAEFVLWGPPRFADTDAWGNDKSERGRGNPCGGARAQLDFLLRYAFDLRGFPPEAEFKVCNLLAADVEWTQGGLLYERHAPGIGYSLSLKAQTGR